MHLGLKPSLLTFPAASSDKTVSVWDVRSGLPTQTFYGHRNSCNHVCYNLQVCKQYFTRPNDEIRQVVHMSAD